MVKSNKMKLSFTNLNNINNNNNNNNNINNNNEDDDERHHCDNKWVRVTIKYLI